MSYLKEYLVIAGKGIVIVILAVILFIVVMKLIVLSFSLLNISD